MSTASPFSPSSSPADNHLQPPTECDQYPETFSRRKMESVTKDFLEAIKAIEDIEEGLSRIERLIVNKRLYHTEPTTLAEIGIEAGVTGEFVRRTQKDLIQRIEKQVGESLETVTQQLKQQLAPILLREALESHVLLVISNASADIISNLAIRLITHKLDYSPMECFLLNKQARLAVQDLKDSASLMADDAGLINERTLKYRLPDNSWEKFWPMLLQCCKFKRIGEHLALRNSARAQVKIALLTIGRPATKEEISSYCEIPLEKIGGQLSAISSISRADKHRWGLSEWIDDEYEGITAEIIQRINEDGGATKLNRLLGELPKLFGVSELSVRTYAATSQFHIRNGYVSLAHASSISLRHIDDVIGGYDKDGFPYWSFVVDNRYLDGYSLTGFPPELARALGCEPNKSIRVKINQPLGCRHVSISWRMSSPTGPSLGYLADPLRKLEAVEPERVLLILKLPDSVEFRLAKSSGRGSAPQERNSMTAAPDALLERIKNRRRVLKC